MRDFSLEIYKSLLEVTKDAGFLFFTFKEYLESKHELSALNEKKIILRHDVDLLPFNSLRFAKLQSDMGINGTYNFRAVPESWDEKIISEIGELGHEIGYHYENMDKCNGDVDKAWDDFRNNLEDLRKLCDVTTVCMHGSPRSKFDNRELWSKYDYRSVGLIGEPYFDINFDEVFYLTDTGRMWDGWKSSVRDKVPQQDKWMKQGLVYHSTNDLIDAVKLDKLPRQIMFNFHPQRWHDNIVSWTIELLKQNIKNQIKQLMIK